MKSILIAAVVTAATLVASPAFAAANPNGAPCHIAVHQRTSGAHKWKVTGRLFRRHTSYANRPVALQLDLNGTFKRLASQRTDDEGRVFLGPIHVKASVTLRFRYAGDRRTQECVSVPFVLTPR